KRIDALRAAFGAEPVSTETLPEDIRDRFVATDGRALIEVYPKEDVLDNDALRRFVADVRAVAPGATDSPVVMLEAGDAVVASFLRATVTSLIVITILLFIVLRRAWNVALMLAPLTLAGVVTIALTVLLDVPFNFANIIVLPLLLGLGVSSGIHLVHRANQDPTVPLMQTSTPRAMVFSVLTTISSFGSLA